MDGLARPWGVIETARISPPSCRDQPRPVNPTKRVIRRGATFAQTCAGSGWRGSQITLSTSIKQIVFLQALEFIIVFLILIVDNYLPTRLSTGGLAADSCGDKLKNPLIHHPNYYYIFLLTHYLI